MPKDNPPSDDSGNSQRPSTAESPTDGIALLGDLLRTHRIHPKDWQDQAGVVRDELFRVKSAAELLARLESIALLTKFQSAYIAQGNLDRLVIGNCRR